jgi:hypothetical protein
MVAEFPGDRLAEWLETDGKERPLDDDGKVTGVRWSESGLSEVRAYLRMPQLTGSAH